MEILDRIRQESIKAKNTSIDIEKALPLIERLNPIIEEVRKLSSRKENLDIGVLVTAMIGVMTILVFSMSGILPDILNPEYWHIPRNVFAVLILGSVAALLIASKATARIFANKGCGYGRKIKAARKRTLEIFQENPSEYLNMVSVLRRPASDDSSDYQSWLYWLEGRDIRRASRDYKKLQNK